MTVQDAAVITATARVRQLLGLTQILTARLETETAAFAAQRPQDVAEGLAETQDLANAYRRESAQVKADPSALAAAPLTERKALMTATRLFDAAVAAHATAVEAARQISEGLVRAIAGEVTEARGAPAGYGASGHAAVADGRAFALNRTA